MARYKDEKGRVLDQIQESVYDKLVFNNATVINTIRNFYDLIQGKNTPVETNLRQSKLLEASVSFQVHGICVDAKVSDPANKGVLFELEEKSGLRLVIGEKDYWKGAMRFLTGKMYVEHAISGSTDSELHFSQYGGPKQHGIMFARGQHVNVPALQTFRLEWTTVGANLALATPAAATEVAFIAQLKGLLRRPVQ